MISLRFFVFTLVLLCSTFSSAADDPNIIVMTEDIDPDAIGRDHSAYKRMLAALQGQMSNRGFNVYEESALLPQNYNFRRSDAQLISLAKGIYKPPLDVMLIFTLYARVDERTAVHKVRAIATGRLLHVNSGQFLDEFEVKSGQTWTIAANCEKGCQSEVVGTYSKQLAQELGSVLAEKLEWLMEPGDSPAGSNSFVTGYSLIFNDFSNEELFAIESELPDLPGYYKHRPALVVGHQAEYWLESSANSADLNKYLNTLLMKHVPGVRFNSVGNTYSFIKKQKRKNGTGVKDVSPDW